MENMLQYYKKIWILRYFIVFLVINDLKQKYRKSYLGMLWAVLQPLMFGIIISLVIGTFTGQSFGDFFPFVFIGLAVWEFISTSVGNASLTYIYNYHYIKQYNNPLMTFSVRLVLLGATNLVFALSGAIFVLFFIDSVHLGFALLILPINLVILIILLSAVVNVIALLGTIFRDLQQLVALSLQALFYMSPILFKPEFFINYGLELVLKFNPVHHALKLFRKPILENQLPSINDYLAILIMIIIAYSINAFYIYIKEKKIIYYL